MSTYWFNVKTLIVDANMLIFDLIKPFELFVTYLLYDNYHYVVDINFYIMQMFLCFQNAHKLTKNLIKNTTKLKTDDKIKKTN